MIPGLKTSFMQRCRWCGQEPEFATGEAELEKFCLRCQAIQDPILSLRNPKTGVAISFFMNPDDGVFIEASKPTGETTRYTLAPEILKRAGVLHKFNTDPRGKR